MPPPNWGQLRFSSIETRPGESNGSRRFFYPLPVNSRNCGLAMTRDPFGWAGQTLEGKYRVDELVGRGGFGVVYRGQHVGLGQPIAIKFLRPDQLMEDEEQEAFLASFRAEGELLHRLSKAHAGIVQALDYGAAQSPSGDWMPYLVLEWLDGHDLATEMKELTEPLSPAQAFSLLTPAAEALAEAHRQRVAHRDVKPENLFFANIAGRRTLKVLDFGIAKIMQSTTMLTATGASMKAFSPRYGAPEQFDYTTRASGTWTDVFAMALIFVELVSGDEALQGEDLIQLHLCSMDRKRRPTPRRRGAHVSDAVETVLARALAVEPKDRFKTMNAFWKALGTAIEQGGSTRGGSGPSRLWALVPVVAGGVAAAALSLSSSEEPPQPVASASTASAAPSATTSPAPRASQEPKALQSASARSVDPTSPRGLATKTTAPATTEPPTTGPPTTDPQTLSSSQPTETRPVQPAATTPLQPSQPSPSCVTCRADGRCALVNGYCVVISSADCRRSVSCRDYGGCANIGGRCAPASSTDCANSRVACRDEKRCRKVGSFCVK